MAWDNHPMTRFSGFNDTELASLAAAIIVAAGEGGYDDIWGEPTGSEENRLWSEVQAEAASRGGLSVDVFGSSHALGVPS